MRSRGAWRRIHRISKVCGLPWECVGIIVLTIVAVGRSPSSGSGVIALRARSRSRWSRTEPADRSTRKSVSIAVEVIDGSIDGIHIHGPIAVVVDVIANFRGARVDS